MQGAALAFGSGLATHEQRVPDRSAPMVSLRNLLSFGRVSDDKSDTRSVTRRKLHVQPGCQASRWCRYATAGACSKLIALVLLAAFATGIAFAQGTFRGDARRGAVKAEACTACHGTAARAPTPGAPSLAAQPPEYLVLQMFLFREGLRDVPQMSGVLKGMTDPDLNDMAAHFSAQPPRAVKSKADEKLRARGAELAGSMGCGSCHLKDFSGQREVPRLAGQAEDYLAASMKAYRDNKRVGSDTNMNGIMSRVNDGDIQALAHYFVRR